jgi:hypothetical protein
MEDKTFKELIEELHNLRIQETVIIAQIEKANKQRTTGARTAGIHEDNRAVIANGLKQGGRVRIKNKVGRLATAGPTWSESNERLATVTRVTTDQVHITTDNGTKTWRAPNNLQLVE